MEVAKVCFACFERLKKSKSQKLRSLTGNQGTYQDMKTSPIFSNSSEPEAGILQDSQLQNKVLGATVGSSIGSRILKSKHLNWSWKGREPFFICNNAFQACWHPHPQTTYTGLVMTPLRSIFFWSFLSKTKQEQRLPSPVYGKIWPHSTRFWL